MKTIPNSLKLVEEFIGEELTPEYCLAMRDWPLEHREELLVRLAEWSTNAEEAIDGAIRVAAPTSIHDGAVALSAVSPAVDFGPATVYFRGLGGPWSRGESNHWEGARADLVVEAVRASLVYSTVVIEDPIYCIHSPYGPLNVTPYGVHVWHYRDIWEDVVENLASLSMIKPLLTTGALFLVPARINRAVSRFMWPSSMSHAKAATFREIEQVLISRLHSILHEDAIKADVSTMWGLYQSFFNTEPPLEILEELVRSAARYSSTGHNSVESRMQLHYLAAVIETELMARAFGLDRLFLSPGETRAYRALFRGDPRRLNSLESESAHSHLTRAAIPRLQAEVSVSDVVALRSSSEVFSLWRNAVVRASERAGFLAETTEAVDASPLFIEACRSELAETAEQVERELQRDKSLRKLLRGAKTLSIGAATAVGSGAGAFLVGSDAIGGIASAGAGFVVGATGSAIKQVRNALSKEARTSRDAKRALLMVFHSLTDSDESV